MEIHCPDCNRKHEIREHYAGKTGKCTCGKRIPFPKVLWTRPTTPGIIRDDLKGCLRDDLRGFDFWPADRLDEVAGLIVFQLEMLPRIPRVVIEQHYASTGLVDPVELASSKEATQNIFQHIQLRLGATPTAVCCVRWNEQCFSSAEYDYIYWVKLQVIPKDRDQPMYFAYRLDSNRYLVDRPRWG